MANKLWPYFQSINDNQCADWDVLITFCNDDPDSLPGGDGHTWEDIAWQKVIESGLGLILGRV